MSLDTDIQSVIGAMPLAPDPSGRIQSLWSSYPEIDAIILIDDKQAVYAFVPVNEDTIARFNALPLERSAVFETGESRDFKDWFRKGNFQDTRGKAAFYNPNRGLLGNATMALAPELLGHFGVDIQSAQKMVISRDGDREIFKPYSDSFSVDEAEAINTSSGRTFSISLTPEGFDRLAPHQKERLLAVLASVAHHGGVGVKITALDSRPQETLRFTFPESISGGPEGRILLEAIASKLKPPEPF